jgi:uncharacterized protein YwgA
LERVLNIIFVADIFGVTDEFNHLCRQVSANIEKLLNENHSLDVKYHLIGPYKHGMSKFLCEQAAYQYFIQHVTLAGYVKALEQQVSAISGPKILVGFSAGGSAVWQLCSQSKIDHCSAAFCFYSSQIRHMTQLTPKIPMTLILPSKESHFSVEEMALLLQEKPTVTLDKSEYLHGFMNKLSDNYHPTAYQYYSQKLAELVFELLPKNTTMQINGK